MPIWAWIVIVAVVVALFVAAWAAWKRRRTHGLRDQFGPEYERAVTESRTRRQGESELEARRKRLRELDIRPLSPQSRQRYAGSWQKAQARFVDSPSAAVREADALILTVMRERGYPMENFEQRSADISVDHPAVVESYRAAHGISMANDQGRASTEDLRQAMVHFRSLFDELLGQQENDRAKEA